MADLNRTITLKWKLWKEYTFNLYAKDTNFNSVKAIYLISKRSNEWNHTFIYIWQTEDLSTRFGNHHKQQCFEQNGYNCIGVMQIASQSDRDYIEKDLIEHNSPLSCNVTYNT